MQMGVIVVGMHLHREVFLGKQKLYQQRDFWSFKPNLADGKPGFLRRSVREPRVQTRGSPHSAVKIGLQLAERHVLGRRPQTRAAMKRCRRSRPRSNSFIEVAYEMRTWSLVPKASPGTTATNSSASSFSENCSELVMPFLKAALTFGYA